MQTRKKKIRSSKTEELEILDVMPRIGIEPMIFALRVRRLTTWPRGLVALLNVRTTSATLYSLANGAGAVVLSVGVGA